MMRRVLLFPVFLAALAFIAVPLFAHGQKENSSSATAAPAKTITIVAASQLPKDQPYYMAFEKFWQYFQQDYHGTTTVKFQAHANGTLGEEKALGEDMINGVSVDMAFIAPSWLATWSKRVAFLGTPFLFKNRAAYDKIISEHVLSPINQDLQNIGLHVLGYGGGEWRSLILNKPVHQLSQLHSITLRVMGSPIQAQVFDAIGVKATPMAYNEVYNAIKTGVVNGLENEPIDLQAMKFYEVAPYLILDRHTFTIRPLLFSQKRLDSFPPDVRAAVLKAGAQAAAWEHHYESSHAAQAIQQMQSKGQIHVINVTSQQKQELINMAEPVIQSFAKKLGVASIYEKISAINSSTS